MQIASFAEVFSDKRKSQPYPVFHTNSYQQYLCKKYSMSMTTVIYRSTYTTPVAIGNASSPYPTMRKHEER